MSTQLSHPTRNRQRVPKAHRQTQRGKAARRSSRPLARARQHWDDHRDTAWVDPAGEFADHCADELPGLERVQRLAGRTHA